MELLLIIAYLKPENLLKSCKGADILINATPLGMMGMKKILRISHS